MAGTYGNSLDSIVLPSQDLHLRINEDIMPTQPEFTQDIQIQFVKGPLTSRPYIPFFSS